MFSWLFRQHSKGDPPPPKEDQQNSPDSDSLDPIDRITLRLGRLNTKASAATCTTRKLDTHRRWLVILQWLYLLSLIAIWLLLWFAADRWWFATMLAFSPRWIYPLPLMVLVPMCLFFDRRRWPILLASNLVLWFPVMDLRCGLGRWSVPSGTRYRVLTCNLHYTECDLAALRLMIVRENPDFIAFQEYNRNTIQSVVEGYQVIQSDGLMVASRFPLHEVGSVSGMEPPHSNPRIHMLLCSAETPEGKLFFGSLHLPSPRYGLSSVLDHKTGIQPSKKVLLEEHIQLRREESAKIVTLAQKLPGPIILAGDFNTPVESDIYRTYWSSYRNAFSSTGIGFGRTFESTVHRIPFGVRIDHILCSNELVPARCGTETTVGSVHLPVLAELIRK